MHSISTRAEQACANLSNVMRTASVFCSLQFAVAAPGHKWIPAYDQQIQMLRLLSLQLIDNALGGSRVRPLCYGRGSPPDNPGIRLDVLSISASRSFG